jgi:hypothetical protein
VNILGNNTVVSINQFSSLSRNEIAEFLTSFRSDGGKVYANTISNLAVLLDFESNRFIPLNRVQLFYLILAVKQLLDGGRLTHRQVVIQLDLDKDTIDNATLIPIWSLVCSQGGLSAASFDEKLTSFYIDCQKRRIK